jgi:hypothetical protein
VRRAKSKAQFLAAHQVALGRRPQMGDEDVLVEASDEVAVVASR